MELGRLVDPDSTPTPGSSSLTTERLAELRGSLAAFAEHASGGLWRRATHLDLLCEKLEAIERGDLVRLLVTMPPRFGKSTVVSEFYPAWYLGNHPDRQVILASYGAEFAESWGTAARNVFREHAPSIWGLEASKFGSGAAWGIERRRGRMYTTGAGGSMTGRGANLMLVDDPIKDASEANSPTYRERTWDWWRATARTRLEPGGAAVILHTRWHEDDLIGRIKAQMAAGGEQWEVVDLPALAEEGREDPLGREPGESLWPEQWPVSELIQTRGTIGDYWFSALYQGTPRQDEGGLFKVSTFRYYTESENGDAYHLHAGGDGGVRRVPKDRCLRFATVDLATKADKRADWFVVAIWDVTPEKDLVLVDVLREHLEGPDQLDALESFRLRHRPGQIQVEANAYQLTFVQAAVRAGLPAVPITVDRDKYARALVAASRYAAGAVYHPVYAPWLADFEGELVVFPRGAHDDQVDVTSAAAAAITPREPPSEGGVSGVVTRVYGRQNGGRRVSPEIAALLGANGAAAGGSGG